MKKLKSLFTVACFGMAMLLSSCASWTGSTISLASDTYFASGSSTVTPTGRENIRQVANRINNNILLISRIYVEGYTDSDGDHNSNMELSKRRAAAVMSELISNGIPARMISAYGYGENKPVASNSTPAGKALNRRVDIRFDGMMLRR